ncbi:hypothetical protein BVY03_04685, partial [bacterium K02(2017)]
MSSPYLNPAILWASLKQKYYYSLFNRLNKDDLKKVSWSSRTTQEARFRIFDQLGDLNNHSLLDIGCGLGDFYRYLTNQGLIIDYTGFDIMPEFILKAGKKYPKAKFATKNILFNPPNHQFDYCFSSGIFAFGNLSFFKQMIEKSFSICKIGYAFNIHQTQAKAFFKMTPNTAMTYCHSLN